jgi:hypothetical protein
MKGYNLDFTFDVTPKASVNSRKGKYAKFMLFELL